MGRTIQTNTRKKPPIMLFNQKNGDMQFGCPFCDKPHIIRTDVVSYCGAHIEVMAVRTKVGTKGHKLVCMRCGNGDGTLIKHGEGYVHDHNCEPNVTILDNPDAMVLRYSKLAKFTYKLQIKWLYDLICKWKKAHPFEIADLDINGQRTGLVRGYVWNDME